MKNNDVAIFILSCDKFNTTWKACIDHLTRSWPSCPYNIYLLNNFIKSDDERVIDLLVGEDLNWSDTLRKGLLKLSEARVFFVFDDSFITQFNSIEVQQVFDIAIKNNLPSVALRKRIFDRGDHFNDKIYKIAPTAKYRNSLFLNLMRKDVLLSLLKSGENAWQFEKVGNIRSKSFDFYSVNNKDIVFYKHGIVKGKWLPSTYNYLIDMGYRLTDEIIGIHSWRRVIMMRVYSHAFYFYHFITHLFKKI